MTTPADLESGTPHRSLSFWQRFWPLFSAGLLGVATLPIIAAPLLRRIPVPEGAVEIPFPVMVLLSLVNPTLLLAATVALGAAITPRVGLESLIVNSRARRGFDWSRLRHVAPRAIVLGIAVGIGTLAIDRLFHPFMSDAWRAAAAGMERPGPMPSLVVGLFYGGITEEIMLRWGMMSLVAWIGWRVVQGGREAPSATIMWSAIVLSSALFGLGHLPAAAAITPLDAMLVVRTVLLNAAAGMVFGWLFWRHHLEGAMLAHMAAHVGLVLIALAGLTGG